ASIEKKYPFAVAFFEQNNLNVESDRHKTLQEYLESFDDETLEERALDLEKLGRDFEEYLNQMIQFLGMEQHMVESLTILPGKNKLGEKESFDALTVRQSEIISIVGPTGSG
ncbi:MAG TPA: ABC transporter, partial [Eubacteriaceae bacterium]|nr:ABC transporter [Eubacteriaceae bacterium]